MLVLSRKKNEAIIIDGYIRVVVADIRGDQVRVGVEASREVTIHREEIQERLDRNGGPAS